LIADKETTIAVVEPVLFNIYGEKNIKDQRPYEIYLFNGYWYVGGTLPEGSKGGTFEIIISSANGRIIKLIHGK
jgi:NTF2 fold immunity protein